MPGCTACNASKKRCPGGVKSCLVEKEKQEKKKQKVPREENPEKKTSEPLPKPNSPAQKHVIPANQLRAQQEAATFAAIMNAPRAELPDVNDPRIWEESSAVQAFLDFPEGEGQPGACEECHEPVSKHYFGCSRWEPR
ncbi:hypothetical protein CLAFUW4_03799 [Fulvia fulva]|uniref:Uncharacterized protein n=1 Tax=Passalora fulva TaxID=5499 RepID=A0A9Q8LCG3_PASFU|nr:uncharacterized protein CLAFUR5_03771 [Fulvia fulva]KAK4632219.1 hypothetical protein CLAFUR4_03787 [Fulvia fulva]KAK4632791.1 hypothetical protein CLAFUR0_03786 [Fulvia fulva]UJO14198.1 hypothetical protein CLAFUR5_03771 [Fulvia fulva]WPV11395.1 hypothetical protein CLAFUW4_03799 [Fulvia fulva]WPV26500.1 hypothetical protein CLAFUW7_03791 [Fulvia fulva]